MVLVIQVVVEVEDDGEADGVAVCDVEVGSHGEEEGHCEAARALVVRAVAVLVGETLEVLA